MCLSCFNHIYSYRKLEQQNNNFEAAVNILSIMDHGTQKMEKLLLNVLRNFKYLSIL